MSPWEGRRGGLQGWDIGTFHWFSGEAGLLDKLFLGRDVEKEVQGLFSSSPGSNCGQKGRTFTEPFGGDWGKQVNGVSK